MKYLLLLFISLSSYANETVATCEAFNRDGEKIIETKTIFHSWLKVYQMSIYYLDTSKSITLELKCNLNMKNYDYYCLGEFYDSKTKAIFKTKDKRGKLTIYNKNGTRIKSYRMYCEI